MVLVYVNHADVCGVHYDLGFKEQVHSSLLPFNPAKFLLLSLVCGPYLSATLLVVSNLHPGWFSGSARLVQLLCTQKYTQNLFYFYKIEYLEICGILYIKIHGF